MRINKRNGKTQAFMPNKVLTRIKSQAKGLKVNPDELFKEVIPLMSDGITTTKIDEIIASKAADKMLIHPDYSTLGGRILMSRQSKLIGKPLQDVDETYDFFAATTFLKKYSKKEIKIIDGKKNEIPIELPSCMYERVASELSKDDNEYQMMLEELKAKRMNFATPIYTNVGIEGRGGSISCNLTHLKHDSIEGIEETLTNISYGSKEGSGIGLLIDPLRSKDSYVSSFNAKAGGVVRFADMVQSKMRFYKQGSRSGACALYLSLWHKDIIDFLQLTLPIGEEKSRARDLFTAVVINDLFMKKLQKKESWYLFCPNDIAQAGLKPLYSLWGDEFEQEYQKAVDMGLGKETEPRKIWDAIIRSQVESGKPYVMFKDNANRKNMQENIGVIKQSNLCLVGDTKVEVKLDGEYKVVTIEELLQLLPNSKDTLIKSFDHENESIDYQDLETIIKTGQSDELLEITDEVTGRSIVCTSDHEIYTLNRGYVKASELTKNDKLELCQ